MEAIGNILGAIDIILGAIAAIVRLLVTFLDPRNQQEQQPEHSEDTQGTAKRSRGRFGEKPGCPKRYVGDAFPRIFRNSAFLKMVLP